MLYRGVNSAVHRNSEYLWKGVYVNRKRMLKKIEKYHFYIVNEPSWSKIELKDTLKKLKKGRMV